MKDYSKHLAEMPRKLSELTQLLNDKEWSKAAKLADEMSNRFRTVADFAVDKRMEQWGM